MDKNDTGTSPVWEYGRDASTVLKIAAVRSRRSLYFRAGLRCCILDKLAVHIRRVHLRSGYRYRALAEAYGLLFRLIREWPEYSGCLEFPVPASHEDTDIVNKVCNARGLPPLHAGSSEGNAEAYFVAVEELYLYDGNMYDPSTEYGRSRRRLLDYIIARLTEEMT